MQSYRRLAPVAILPLAVAAMLMTSCEDQTSQHPLLRPQTGRYALGGRVRLVANLTGPTGDSVGTRVVDDADGVRVRLLTGGASVDSVYSQGGVFEFRVDDVGAYTAAAWVCPESLRVSHVTLADADTTFPDTLTLRPFGELHTYPNPFPATEGLAIEFTAPVAQRVTTEIHTLGGVTVWSYSIDLPAGFFHLHWNGNTNDNTPLPAGAYWVVVQMGGRHHCSLVFKE